MTLRRFLLKIDANFEKKLSNKFHDWNLDRILSNSLEEIKGEHFYRISILILGNFDLNVINGFSAVLKNKKESFQLKTTNKIPKESNINRDFIRKFMVLQEDIANKAYIDYTRLSKLVNKTDLDFYAWEVVSIALSNNISPLTAFSQLYK
ncbi:hypothetical protein [Sphingobacterium multivorum]|uniref:hypothetical protein n=1 Tax=Sphingobacterium multivorum TaxID=28454 RepID=UPI0030178BAE